MQNLNISQFNIRLAVGALLAMSAVLAVVMSFASSPQNGASADGDTNSDKVKNAVSALETAVATPAADLNDLIVAGTQIHSVQWNHDSATDTDGTGTANISIAPPVTVVGSADNATAMAVPVGNALGSEYVLGWAGVLTTARTTETTELTNTSEGVPARINTITSAPSVTLADGSTTATPVAGNTLAADLATIQTELLTTTRTAKAIHADIKAKVYTAFGLEDVDGQEELSSGDSVLGALNILYTPDNPATTDTDEEDGDLFQLESARKNEKAALAGIKAILVEVNKSIVTADDSAKVTINSASNADSLFDYESTSPRLTRATTKTVVANAEKLLTALLAELETIDGDELTAFDQLDALTKVLTDIAGEAPTGVLKARIDDIDNALLANNVDDLDSDADPGETDYSPDAINLLKSDATNHIVSALKALVVLDGKAAQKTAIQELIDLLTNVDDVVTTTGAADDVVNDLTQADADRLKAALDAFDALERALEARYIDTSKSVAANQVTKHRADLNDLEDNELSDSNFQGFFASYTSASEVLSRSENIDRDAAITTTARKLFDALNKEGVLGAALATAPASGIDEITDEEFSTAIGADIATNGSNTASTSDLHNTLTRFLAIEAAIDSVDTDGDTAGIQPPSIMEFNRFELALQAAFDNEGSDPPTDNMAKANALAVGYRSSTLEFDAHAAMAALLKALEDAGNASGDGIPAAVATAREALIIVYDHIDAYDDDTMARITAAYNGLIRDGSTSHQYAQQAALAVVLKGLKDKTGAATLATNIQNALKTQSPEEKKAQAKIAEIKAGIVNAITVSGGDKVKLDVNVYGVQGIMDQKLADDVTFDWGDASSDTGPSITYTAPTAPGSYDVTASLELNECYHADADTQMAKCSATFTVKVRRQSPAQPQDEAPVNPATVPSILTDSSGNQYEVFTPVEGGTFDNGDGYSITAQSGDVPNNEIIGVRMSDDGSASNLGMTHQRYTLGGNMYGIHVVDGTGTTVSSYVLDDPAQVCLPLPSELSSNISKVALVAMNSDGTLTILSSSVKLGSSGTSVCGNISTLPASVAVGHVGSPAAIPTATPEPTPVPPPTGATAPTNTNGILIWAILFGLALTGAGVTLVMARRRGF